ncbi:MAG: histidinol dehydrogenase [Eubacteriales bacterium]|nr:histidinol dehydrogenase [Eubacteriales bacterium]
MKIIKQPLAGSHARDSQLTKLVADIIDKVQAEGDSALLSYTEQFDRVKLSLLRVDEATIKAAYDQVEPETVETLKFAAGQIEYFATRQRECLKELSIESKVPGLEIGHRMVPVDRCACYVPAGRHPLPSSALMTIINARVAGVKEIAACSPAFNGGSTIHPAVLVAMDIAGATEIYCMGGAQAIAAFTYGTETIKKVDMIVGPGNKYVAEAKRQVQGIVGIDSVAGPSEVLIVADETADPKFLAIDLLGQAEHDPNAQSILVCTSEEVINKTLPIVDELLAGLETSDVAGASWRNNGTVYLADDIEEAIAISNSIAPEHLEVQTANEREVAAKLCHYGSMFVGKYATVAFGDFVSGPNHTLPTMSTARFSSGLWVGTFIKTPFHQFVTKEGCMNLAPATMRFAEVEGLPAHRDSVRLRVE